MDQETPQSAVTIVLLCLIAIFFLYYYGRAKALRGLCSQLKAEGSDPLQKLLKIKGLEDLARQYQTTISVKLPDGMKTSCPSADYFGSEAVSSAAGINLRILNAAAGLLVGLGLLGTFIGLVVGLRSFNLDDPGTILANLRQLTGGMWMAFLTSIVGMGCSIFFLHYYKGVLNEFRKQLRSLTDALDWAYYSDDANLFAEVLREQLEHVQDPVSALVTDVVEKLKNTMEDMIAGFREEVAGAARSEFETLTERLRKASDTLAGLPAGMQKISDGLPGMIESVTRANEETMRKAQETAELFGRKADELASGLAAREKELTDLQSKAASRIKAVLGGLDQSIAKLAEANTGLSGSADLRVKAQGGIADAVSGLQGVAGDMRASLDSFRAAQQDFSENMGKIQQGGQECISRRSELIDESRSLTDGCARDFGTIKDGLKDVFGELQKDLAEYSGTVRKSTQSFLDQYTDSLTKTAGSLSDTVQKLTDTLGKGRK